MPDDLDRLRHAMAALSEHGGAADLHDRALHTSRRIGRRRAAAVTAGIIAVASAITVPIAVAQDGRRDQANWQTSGSVPASPAPVIPPSSAPPATGCPVTAATLQAVAKLPDGNKIDAATIACWKLWAVAEDTAPTPEQDGDGATLFTYSPTTGLWREVTFASEFDCAEDLGLKKGDDHPVWCSFFND